MAASSSASAAPDGMNDDSAMADRQRRKKRLRGAEQELQFSGDCGPCGDVAFENASQLAGPSSLLELMQWPEDIMGRLFSGASGSDRKTRLLGFLSKAGVDFSTDYSGCGGAEVFLSMGTDALITKFGCPDRTETNASLLTFHRACVIDKECRDCLAQLGTKHIFRDIVLRIPSRGLFYINALTPDSEEFTAEQYARVQIYIRKRAALCFTDDQTGGPCSRHPGERCRVVPDLMDTDSPGRHEICWASASCQPWSSYGNSRVCADRRSLPFALWLEERRYRREAVICVENSHMFPISLISMALAETHMTMYARITPHQLGYPVHRPRLYTFSFNLEQFLWLGPKQSDLLPTFLELMGRRCVADVDAFVADSPENVGKFYQHIAKQHSVFAKDPQKLLSMDIRKLLNPTAAKAYEAYEAEYQKLLAEQPSGKLAYVSDLGQNPCKRFIGGTWLRSVTTRPQRYSHSARRLLTPAELWAAHGWPSISADPSLQQRMPFDLAGLPYTTQLRLVGNGLHLATAASFFFFCLSNLAERETMAGGLDLWRWPPDEQEEQQGNESDAFLFEMAFDTNTPAAVAASAAPADNQPHPSQAETPREDSGRSFDDSRQPEIY